MGFRVASQRYACQRCGRCCRRFLIPLGAGEVRAISRLPWPSPADRRSQCYRVLGGRAYLRADSRTAECLYLAEGDLCRMHHCFGALGKPIACRAYPFAFMRTFGEEVSVAARFDCPAVQANQGEALGFYRGEWERLFADPLMPPLPPPISPAQMDGLTRRTLETVADFLKEALEGGEASLPALQRMVRRLRQLGPAFLNDQETLPVVLPSMLEKAMGEFPREEPVVGALWPERVRLRQRMLECLRFDRQLPDFSLGARLRQMGCNAAILWGHGNPRAFGPQQPDLPLHRANLFQNDQWRSAPEAWKPYRRCLAVRLETRQFFASAYYGKGFFDGLEALLDTWGTAVVLARLHAATAHPGRVQTEDAAYAAGLLDHLHGRKSRGASR